MTFIVDLLKAGAWPLTVFVLGLVYRKPLTDAIHRMTEIQGPGVKAVFSKELEAVRSNVTKALESTSPPPLNPTPGGVRVELAAAPVESVDTAWRRVEATLAAAVEAGLAPPGDVPNIVAALVDKKIISESARDSIMGLRHLSSMALLSRAVPPEQALDFIGMANAISWTISRDFEKAKKGRP